MKTIKRLKSALNEARDVEASLKSWTVVDDVRTDFDFNIPKGAQVTYIARMAGGKSKVEYNGKECFVDSKILKQVEAGQKQIPGCACGESLTKKQPIQEAKSGKMICRYGMDAEFGSHDDPRDVIWAGGYRAGVDQSIIDQFKSTSKKVARSLGVRTEDIEIQAKEGKIFLLCGVSGEAAKDVEGVEYRDMFSTAVAMEEPIPTEDAGEAPPEETEPTETELEETPLQ